MIALAATASDKQRSATRQTGSADGARRDMSETPEFTRIASDRWTAADGYMSWRACPACGGERHRQVLAYQNFQFYTDADRSKQVNIRQVQCLQCFAVFMNPVFNAAGFATLFAEAGGSYGSTPGRYGEQVMWLIEQGLLGRQTTLLDIGCFDGTFVSKLPENVRGIGVDVDRSAIERAKRAFAKSGTHRFICADFERVEVDATIDVITMFHVFEHLPRPVEVLKRLAGLSTAKTRLVIEVPVLEHVDYGDVCGFLGVHHLTHFSIGSLRNVLRAGGWELQSSHKMAGYNGYRIVAGVAPCSPCVPEQGDVGRLLSYLHRWYAAVGEVEARLRRIDASRCVLRGGGAHTEYLFHLTSLFSGDRSFLVVEADQTKHGKSWRGIPIVGPKCLGRLDWDDTQIVLSSYSHQESMRKEAQEMGIPAERVVALYDHTYRC